MLKFFRGSMVSLLRRISKLSWTALCFVLLAPAGTPAQTSDTGIVLGRVLDQTGAVVAGAQVELTNERTGAVRTQTANEQGQYVFPNVRPGAYRLTVTIQGFQTAQVRDVTVEVTKSYTHDVTLQVGDVTSTIEVRSEASAELQTTDATVGNVLSGRDLPRMPTLTRAANELLTLQPGVTSGGAVTGSRTDQTTFALNGVDVTNQSVGGLGTYIPLPVEGVEEFRVAVANPTASFGRGGGGQVAVVGRSGSPDIHGAVFWYHQNDNLNAHTWTDKRLGKDASGADRVPEPELKDNRFGFRVGGPVWPWDDKLFFFLHYEGRRFPRSTPVTRLVPTDMLRMGTLQFRDGAGNVVAYDLATAAVCGATSNLACDPRGLGLSPVISSLWSNLPAGNDTSSGDGLNTIGFRSNVGNPINNNYYNARVDYNLTAAWKADAQFNYFGQLQNGSNLLSIVGGTVESKESFPLRQNYASAGIHGPITPSLWADFRFGWVVNRTATDRQRPNQSATQLAIPGTDTPSGFIALDLGALGGTQSLLSEPIDVGTQVARKQISTNRNFQYNADLTWTRGAHTVQFGSHIRYLPTDHLRDDKVLGSLGALVAQLDSDLGAFTMPSTSRPPTCSASITTDCIRSADVRQWNRLYATALGMIDNVSVLAARDGDFNPLPFGELLEARTKLWSPEFYVQDVWRLHSTLTLTAGVNYGWQTPPKEKLGRQSIQIDGLTLEEQTSSRFFRERRNAAMQGNIFNPPIAFMPINSASRDGVFDTDWNNVAPRFAAAWNPSFDTGVLGLLFGKGKTVIRGGYGLVYDRQNTVQSVIIPTLGVAFGQTINVTAPPCDSTGPGGPGCNATSTNPALGIFRVGPDGVIPVPVVPAQSVPVSPFWGVAPGTPGPPFPASSLQLFPEVLSFQVDPRIEVGKNHAVDVSWQRELPQDMILEIVFSGRYARSLTQSMNFGQIPFMQLDTASGQTFAQAYDALALQLRAGTASSAVSTQPWFENQVPAGACVVSGSPVPCTQWLATTQTSNFINGNLNSIFLAVDTQRMLNGLQSFNNYLARTLFLRSSTGLSNYNALLLTVRKRMSRGLTYSVNYTFSRSLDQLGAIQNAASVMPNNFDLNAEYGPSGFDFTHLFNTTALWELPFGRGRYFGTSMGWLDKLVGGWYVSSVFTSSSGAPLTVTQGSQVWGGSIFLGFSSGAIPTVNPGSFGNSAHSGVVGANNVGTNGDPANNGSGINLFADPESVFNSFRRVEISRDGRSGRANPLRGFPRWNLDMSIGKRTAITEQIGLAFSFDFFNVFNHVDFDNPSLSLTNSRAFGVVTSQFDPPNRTVGSRWIQFGVRVDF